MSQTPLPSARGDTDGIATLQELMVAREGQSPRLLAGIIFDFDHTLAFLDRPHEDLMAEGARMAQDYMEQSGMELFPDFWEQIISARQFAQEKSEEEAEEHIANDTMSFLLQFCGYPASKMDSRVLATSVDLFYAPEMQSWRLYDGVMAALSHLRHLDVNLAIVANHPCERVFQRIVDYLELRPWFDVVLCSASVEWRKPSPEIFTPVLDRWRLQPYEVAVVGDSLRHDIGGGADLGTMTMHCDLGTTDRQTAYDNQQLARRVRPDATLTDWQQFMGLIQPWLY
ncbi:MAG: HAD family hydrolase [Caldilineaceae bacterium SB0665_bin_21]|nr:HAD family hydrolase [Caldilineaceae bacterium SB0665_bin_21]MYA05621.1 HAD family hydrolase [Caldilineaceae bacterium SB0664_bin_22]MYC61469.1 HAD family hydrolase [Caldilineaceae bacterium SB0661_bin_34]